MHARGITIDVTDSEMDGDVEGQAMFANGFAGAASPLREAADHAIAACEATDRIGGSGDPALRLAADLLPPALGRRLARSGSDHHG